MMHSLDLLFKQSAKILSVGTDCELGLYVVLINKRVS